MFSVPRSHLPRRNDTDNISGREIKGAQCSLYQINDPEEYIQSAEKNLSFR